MSLWHLACEKRSFTWATKYIKSICTTLLSLCIYYCAPQFTVLHRIVPECFTHHILHLLLRHVFLLSGSKQINHKKSCTTQLHNTAPLARNWSALGICCTEREREKMTDITEVVKKNSTFSKETNIKKIATKLSWRTKQTHKHANIWIFFYWRLCFLFTRLCKVQIFSNIWLINPLTEKFCVLISCLSFIDQSWSPGVNWLLILNN